MNISRYRTNAQNALASLEEAVLGVMFEAREPLRPAEISRRLDIPLLNRGRNYYTHAIALAILHELELKGLVRQVAERRPWVLTDKAIRKLEEN